MVRLALLIVGFLLFLGTAPLVPAARSNLEGDTPECQAALGIAKSKLRRLPPGAPVDLALGVVQEAAGDACGFNLFQPTATSAPAPPIPRGPTCEASTYSPMECVDIDTLTGSCNLGGSGVGSLTVNILDAYSNTEAANGQWRQDGPTVVGYSVLADSYQPALGPGAIMLGHAAPITMYAEEVRIQCVSVTSTTCVFFICKDTHTTWPCEGYSRAHSYPLSGVIKVTVDLFSVIPECNS